jgi:hypothetical protein
VLGLLAAAVAVSACGGNGDEKAASTGAVATGATAQAGATGATAEAGTTGQAGTTAEAGSTGSTRRSGSKRSQAPKSSDSSSGGSQGSTESRTPSTETKTTDDKGKKGKKKESAWDSVSNKRLRDDARKVCRAFGLQRIATEYQAKSQTAADAASVYADSFLRGGAPRRVWKPVYEGCIAGLTGH